MSLSEVFAHEQAVVGEDGELDDYNRPLPQADLPHFDFQ